VTILAAAVQFAPIFKAKTDNLRRLASLVIDAAEHGAKLIVLPELAATGYSFMSPEEAEPFAEVIQDGCDGSFEVMQALSRKYNVCIAWGLIEKDQGTGKLYNSQVLMCPDAWESYRKVNLWGNDFLWASEGRGNPQILRVDFGDQQFKVGLLICRDIRDKKDGEWESFYDAGDADIVAMSANWGDGGFPSVGWIDFAKSNAVCLVVSNRYGREVPNNFGEGGVCVIHKDGAVVATGLKWNQDCIVYSEVG